MIKMKKLVAATIATSGIPFANTISLAYSSFMNSLGTNIYTGGLTPVSVSLGFASYDFSNDAWNSLLRKGNEWYEYVGYGLGTLAIASDIMMMLGESGYVDLITEHSDKFGHSSVVEHGYQVEYERKNVEIFNRNKTLVSFGPGSNKKLWWLLTNGDSQWPTYAGSEDVYWRQTLQVNLSAIKRYSSFLTNPSVPYSVIFSSCVTHTSLALNLSGVFNIGIHPYLLAGQMSLWNAGVRPWFFSTYLTLN